MEDLYSLSHRDLLLLVQDFLQTSRENFASMINLLEILADEKAKTSIVALSPSPVKRCRSLACAMKPKKAALLKFDSRIGKCFALSVDHIHTSNILTPFKLMAILPSEGAIYPQLQSRAFRGQSLIINPIFSYITLIAAYT